MLNRTLALPIDSRTSLIRESLVDQVEFQGDIPLTESQRANLAKEIQEQPFVVATGESETDWAAAATQVIVRGTLQDMGYFKASAEGNAYLIRATGHELHFALRIEIQSGPQYRFGDIHFVSTDDTPLVFTENDLRQQLDLKSGDLFNTSKIRLALENINEAVPRQGLSRHGSRTRSVHGGQRFPHRP